MTDVNDYVRVGFFYALEFGRRKSSNRLAAGVVDEGVNIFEKGGVAVPDVLKDRRISGLRRAEMFYEWARSLWVGMGRPDYPSTRREAEDILYLVDYKEV